MFDISQIPAGPVHATGDKLQMAPYNVRAMARFVNIHKQGLREQAQQNEKMRLELVKYIDTSKTQGFNDLQEAKLELVKHIDTWTNGYSDLLLEQLNSVSAEKNVLSKRNAEITASLEVERELKRSKTEAFDRQGVELERVKKENYDLSNTKSELTASLEVKTEAFDKQGVELERVKKENYDLSKTKSELTGSLELKTEAFDKQGAELERVKTENSALFKTKSELTVVLEKEKDANDHLKNANLSLHDENHVLDREVVRLGEEVKTMIQTNADFASEVSRHNAVIHELRQQVGELNRDNKQLENEKASLYQLQQKCNSNDPPPRRFSVPQPGQW